MTETTSAVPNPGTIEAGNRGCTCPVIDNHYGKGFRGQAGVFMYSGDCPLHCGVSTESTGARPS